MWIQIDSIIRADAGAKPLRGAGFGNLCHRAARIGFACGFHRYHPGDSDGGLQMRNRSAPRNAASVTPNQAYGLTGSSQITMNMASGETVGRKLRKGEP